MPILHTSALSRYVEDADAAPGGYADPAMVARYEPLDLRYDTSVDQTLSPYSDAYFDQQMALYREVAGRPLDQELGELHSDNVDALRHAPNPTGIPDAATLAEYVRCVSSMLALAGLGERPTVLDMGAGHGLGSEVLAYTGCAVHAVDIDPGLGALSRERVAARNLDVTRFDLNFDDIGMLEDGRYDGAFFFQALHHCLRPWKLIADLKTKLQPDGVIAFVGEPIQSIWWRHWGLRLDPVSLYVARKSGWFESGWSHEFIRDCFVRNGYQLTFLTGGYRGDEIGIATASEAKRDAVLAHAHSLGFHERHAIGSVGEDNRYRSGLGEVATLCGRPAFRQRREGTDALIYGPYAAAAAGRYEVSLLVRQDGPQYRFWRPGRLTIDAIHGGQVEQLLRASVRGRGGSETRLLHYRFDLDRSVQDLEVRVFSHGAPVWTVSVPAIRRLEA